MKRLLIAALIFCGLGAASAQTPYVEHHYNLGYQDSLEASATMTTRAIYCFGADYVVFYYGHRDTAGTCSSLPCRTWYSDSLSGGGLAFTNDTTYFPAVNSGTVISPAGVIIGGDGIGAGVRSTSVNPGVASMFIGGGRMITATPYHGSSTSTGGRPKIMAKWVRFAMTNQSRGRGSAACAACADMYKPAIPLASVIWLDGKPTPASVTFP